MPEELDPNDPRLVDARLGAAVEREFEGSVIMTVIRAAAAEARAEAMDAFVHADPRDIVAVTRLQERFSLPETVERWVQAAIERGQVAADELREDPTD